VLRGEVLAHSSECRCGVQAYSVLSRRAATVAEEQAIKNAGAPTVKQSGSNGGFDAAMRKRLLRECRPRTCAAHQGAPGPQSSAAPSGPHVLQARSTVPGRARRRDVRAGSRPAGDNPVYRALSSRADRSVVWFMALHSDSLTVPERSSLAISGKMLMYSNECPSGSSK